MPNIDETSIISSFSVLWYIAINLSKTSSRRGLNQSQNTTQLSDNIFWFEILF